MAEPLLAAEGLRKRFGGVVAVAGVSLDLHPGEIHAVIGPNGAGKSTLINLLSGDMRASEGAVRLEGRRIDRLGPDRRGLAGIGRSYQKTTIFPRFTAFENARLAAQAHARRPLRMFARPLDDRDAVARAEQAIAAAGLAASRDVAAGLLSHGGQRQLEIAMVLATDPRVVLLDEPLAGMGPAEAQEMIALIRGLKGGRAVLIVEHDMDAVFALADRLTVMANGQVIASGAPDAVRADPAVRAAYLGEDGPP
ncbi:MAG: ABC transporter ATP-binding protein [Alphaproteobacteria bacterium]